MSHDGHASDCAEHPPVAPMTASERYATRELVHGVGVGAWAFAEVASALAADHRVLVPHRRATGRRGARSQSLRQPASVAEQVDELLRVLVGRGSRRRHSSGCRAAHTLVVAVAMAEPAMVRAAVVHEPVIGPLAPELHAVLKRAAACLAASGDGTDGVLEFMTDLVGEERIAACARTGGHRAPARRGAGRGS